MFIIEEKYFSTYVSMTSHNSQKGKPPSSAECGWRLVKRTVQPVNGCYQKHPKSSTVL